MTHLPPRDPRRQGYARVKANTAGPAERVVMMYDGIVKQLNLALEAFALPAPESYGPIHEHLAKAGQLVTELRLALDQEQGGELARTLARLYDYWTDEISQANMEKRPRRLQDVIAMVNSLREAWQQAQEGVVA